MSAANGMVSTSHPLAVEAGLGALRNGGSAADAAVAAAAMLTVVDPRSTGLGGDLFALYWEPGRPEPVGLASAGVAPAGMDVETLRRNGFESMPPDGPWTVTVPGAPWGWTAMLDRFGRLDFADLLRPAIDTARGGFEVSPMVADEWLRGVEKLRRNPAASAVFLLAGRAPAASETFTNAGLADTLELFVAEGHTPFYSGEIAAAMAEAVAELGGPLRRSDLSGWTGPEWTRPIGAPYRGVSVFEMPPPSQGVVVLEAMRIYEGLPQSSPGEADHFLIESLKAAFGDAADHVADPRFEPVPLSELLNEDRLAAVRDKIGPDASDAPAPGLPGDTVFVCVVDGSGAACSLIQSLYEAFGSGIAARGTGLLLQNRGNGFTLRDHHPNRPQGGKRPYHTTIPAMLADDAGFLGCLGSVGGFMQPQGQLQILRNIVDRGMSAQEAVDAPRLRVLGGRRVGVESGFDEDVQTELTRRGHMLESLPRFECGGVQMILRSSDGLDGGSDRRKDGFVGVC
jgi:gamma-glutamyltranspeptidase/glutathione hydrolase